MVEEAGPGQERQGEGGPPAAADVPDDPERHFTWRRRRWPAARRGRPSWWEVPPQGYLEIESRNAPTSPRALRVLARAAAKAGLSWNPDKPLPVQRFVEAQERARLAFHARRELSRVTAVASQVMVVDSRLAEAETTLRQAAIERSAAAKRAAGRTAVPRGTTASLLELPGPPLGQPSQRRMLGPWTEAVILAVVAGGEGVLAYGVGRDLGLGAVALGILAVAAGVGSIAAAQLAARGLDRFGAMADGSEDPDRRRWMDVAVAGIALACGVTLTIAMGHLTARAGRSALGLALLGLAAAVAYAAIPDRTGARDDDRSRSAVLHQLQEHRRRRRQLRTARAREAAAQAAARQLREELALLVPQLFAAEQAALLFWRYQVAIGAAARHAFEQHLAAFTTRRSRGVWRPIAAWWLGAPRLVSDAGTGFASAGEAPSEWGDSEWNDQVARVTMAAKRALVRRGLLDITHTLWLSRLPGASPAGNGGPARGIADVIAGNSDRTPVVPPALDTGPPDGR
jgi:hypothetical protein